MNQLERISYLLNKVSANTATPEELQELADVVLSTGNEELLRLVEERFASADEGAIPLPTAERQSAMIAEILSADKLSTTESAVVHKLPFWTMARKIAAALIIILVTSATYFIVTRYDKDQAVQPGTVVQVTNDRLPGTNRATLTLADGSVVYLDSTAAGTIAQQGNASVTKSDNGELVYQQLAGAGQETGLMFNTIVVPRGGTYELVLSDGTHVWLNSASTLKYPSSFTTNERNVELTGEAYFEVAKNPSKPFHVIAKNMKVEVVGTHFNMMVYEEENVQKVTLLEGAVNVVSQKSGVELKPGKQASLNLQNQKLGVEEVDADESVAWIKGYFQVNRIDEVFMRQLARWYDIEVVYEGAIKPNEFKGTIARSIKLSNVVQALRESGINCRIENNKLIITP